MRETVHVIEVNWIKVKKQRYVVLNTKGSVVYLCVPSLYVLFMAGERSYSFSFTRIRGRFKAEEEAELGLSSDHEPGINYFRVSFY